MKPIGQILADPVLNGVYRLAVPSDLVPVLDGKTLKDKDSLLIALGRALDFPDYYGINWDALEECLADMSWHSGPIVLRIEHAGDIPPDILATFLELFTEAVSAWRGRGRACSLFLGGMTDSGLPPAC